MKAKSFPKRALSVFLIVLVVFSVFAVALTTSMQNAHARTGDTLVGTKTFNSTLFDYYYDSEMVDSSILQGVAKSYTNEAYHMLNNAASDYYESNGVETPIYFGNFYKQDVNTVFDYSQKPQELYKYTWTANLANRSNPNAVAQGIFADTLVDGVPAQNGAGGTVKVPYFDKEWLTTKIGQSAMVVNFSFRYPDGTTLTMPFAEGDSTGANTFRLFEVIEPGTNYYFAERGLDCNALADDMYKDFLVNENQIGINFKFESWEGMPESMNVNIMTPAGNIISVPMNANANDKSFWLVIDKNDSATANVFNQITATGKDVQMGEVYENLNFPFDVIDNNGVAYYQFTTREYKHDINNDNKDANGNPAGVTTGQNNIYFNGTDWAVRANGVDDWNFDELSAADPEWAYDNDMGSGFFPMNASDPAAGAANDDERYIAKRDLKYGYAVKYDIPFTLSSDGMVIDKDGNKVPTTFEFMGDDDLLVYIDGELVLDMGGAHKMAKGKIDFSTGEATVTTGAVIDIAGQEASGDPLNTKNRAGLNELVSSSNGILKEFIDNNKTYDPTAAHTMTIYYVERGMFNANAFIRFNLPVNTSVEVEKEADYTALTEEQKESYFDDEFTYNFKLTTINDNPIEEYAEGIWENITNVDFDNVKGDTYTFTLKAGEKVLFDNIPANIGYVISEMDAENYTLNGVYAQNLTETDSEMTKLDKLVANGKTDGRTNVKYKFVNAANEVPTTTVPPTTAPTTPAPTTTQAPTTTVAPTTTQAPTTTVAPTTTQAPTTTVAPTTTQAPTTTVAPTTEPTEAPTTTVAPTTEPTEAPTTTAVPTTTAEPTEPPTTTAAPTTTAEPTEAPTTTMAPETMVVTTTAAPTTLPVPDVPKTGDNVMFVYVAMIALLAGVACIYIKKRTVK